jgi:RND superfamily putative drug exporter
MSAGAALRRTSSRKAEAVSELGEPGRLARLIAHRRNKYIVPAIWLVMAFIGGFFAFGYEGGLTKAQENDVSAWLPGDAESTRAIEGQEKFFSPNEIPTTVVFERSNGTITLADKDAVHEMAAAFGKLDHVVTTAPSTQLSHDREALQVTVKVDPGTGGWETLLDVTDEMRDMEGDLPDGLSMHITGPGGTASDFMAAFSGGDIGVMLAALAVVIAMLLLTYRSPILWLIPVISAVCALLVAMGFVRGAVGLDLVTVNGQTMFILPVLVIGAATDYALLIVARYREELRHHEDKHEAMALALHRAGPAVFASGLTVMIGLLCLLAATMTPTQSLGPVCAIGILFAIISMLTLLPSILLICGRGVFWPVRPSFGSDDHLEDSVWARVGSRISRAPRPVWVATTLALCAVALGTLTLDAKGLKNEDAFINKPESVAGAEVLADHFDAGTGDPIYVLANADKAGEIMAAVKGVDGVDAATLFQLPPKDETALMGAELTDGSDTQAARNTVERVRDAVHGVADADALVTGTTAQNLDMLDASADDNRIVIPLVLLVVFLILCWLLRAAVAPVLLLLTVVLSFAAALGISALLFEHVFGFEGADPSYPLWCFVFLVALGIDYNIFLMTRVHEETKRVGTRQGALVGLRATGGVITAAGLVLAGTFSVLGTLPMVFAAELGITVALGVLIDTLIVRSVLVTALTLDIGRWMWWPSALFHAEDPGKAA